MMPKFIWMHLLLLSLVACVPLANGPEPAPTANTCGDWVISATLSCYTLDERTYLLQSAQDQVTVRHATVSVVIDGSVVFVEDDTFTVVVLAGTAIVGAHGRTRVIPAGRQLTLMRVDDSVGDIPEPENITSSIRNTLQALELPSQYDLDALLPLPTMTAVAPREAITCDYPPEWRYTYTVVSGDTVASIADRVRVPVAELADGNCLLNASQILVGLQLRVPSPAQSASAVPSVSIGFRSDAYAVSAGTCTILYWDGFGAQVITLNEEIVAANGQREVCPTETTSYRLRVTIDNERHETRELTISVTD